MKYLVAPTVLKKISSLSFFSLRQRCCSVVSPYNIVLRSLIRSWPTQRFCLRRLFDIYYNHQLCEKSECVLKECYKA